MRIYVIAIPYHYWLFMTHSKNKQREIMATERLLLLLLRAVTLLVASGSALVANNVISALAGNMTGLLAIVADDLVGAVAELVSRLLAAVANDLVGAITSKMTRSQTFETTTHSQCQAPTRRFPRVFFFSSCWPYLSSALSNTYFSGQSRAICPGWLQRRQSFSSFTGLVSGTAATLHG